MAITSSSLYSVLVAMMPMATLNGSEIEAFDTLLRQAAKFGVMRNRGHVPELVSRLEDLLPHMERKQHEVIAHTLCAFLMVDYPWISATQMDNLTDFS